ncbi:MAG TPA: cytochrome d ubiquinol oxidase subunit II [Gammaproteobacteria bacterium]|jgi:cytochrome d ubiquinol oxidase subunit II|nr:cytochrome d ubiquinol oxidase subunit II [Gammaproteobacteria bacterium]
MDILPLIWVIIIAVGVMIYVILDGFDLGIGILFPFARQHQHRDLMMNSIAPVWDGNETWLVMGGAGLLAAFPRAYAILLSGLYVPLMLMLTALIFRGISFEFRFKAHKSRFLWDIAFSAGSMLAALCQGITLGAVVQGVKVLDGQYAGGPYDWLSPFTLLTGASVMIGYALLGSTWLIMKTEGELQARSYRAAKRLLPALLIAIAAVSLWTPYIQPAIRERWFSLPNFYYLSQIPFLTFLLAVGCWYALKRGHHSHAPFYCSIGLFILAYIGLIISIWPYIVPRALTYQQAASPASSQLFLLAGFIIVMPLVLGYTAMGYRIFSGKIQPGSGYH